MSALLYRRQQYKEALYIWEAALPQWQQERDATLAFSYRKAEICAIEDKDWRKAAGWLAGVRRLHTVVS